MLLLRLLSACEARRGGCLNVFGALLRIGRGESDGERGATFEVLKAERIAKGLPICRGQLARVGVYLHCS